MAIDLSANGPQFFTMNGVNFEKRVEGFDINIYHQGRRVGTVSSDLAPKIYFDTTKLGLEIFGGFSINNWRDTLNHAVSVSPIVNAHYAYNRRILQEILDHLRIQDTLMDIQFTVYQDGLDYANNMDIDDEDDNLEDDEDDNLEYDEDADNYEFFWGNNGMFGAHLPIEPLAYY